MPSLRCDVRTCLHNSDKCCCKNTILVEGREARESDNTCCSSYDEAREYGYRNEFETRNLALAVECAAVNCRFNEDCRCSAKHITISGGDAREMAETRCASFEEKEKYAK